MLEFWFLDNCILVSFSGGCVGFSDLVIFGDLLDYFGIWVVGWI